MVHPAWSIRHGPSGMVHPVWSIRPSTQDLRKPELWGANMAISRSSRLVRVKTGAQRDFARKLSHSVRASDRRPEGGAQLRKHRAFGGRRPEMQAPQLRHERLPHRRASLFEKLGAN